MPGGPMRDGGVRRLLANWRTVLADVVLAGRLRLTGGHCRPQVEALRRGALAPVVMIPGVYESWRFMLPLAERVHAAGHPVHLLPELGWNRRPIPRQAALVAAGLAERQLRGVVLLGHSKGGLIGKRLMLAEDPERRVDRLVTLATPFHGSSYARLMLQPALREFRPRAAMLAALAGEPSVDARITSIYPEWDEHLPGGSLLPGAHNVEVPVRGHFRVLVDPRAAAAVLAAIDAGRRGPAHHGRSAN
ncbi:MAG: alpha/beta hydrolase [Microbacteriaceae bacterium]